jgi:hypothetical protein
MARGWGPLASSDWWPRGVVIGAVAAPESAEMGLAQDEEALAAD